MSLKLNPRSHLRPSSATTKASLFTASVGKANARYLPAFSPSASLISTDDTSTITADFHQLGIKKDSLKDSSEACATKVFVRVRPFMQREIGKPTPDGNASSCVSESPMEFTSVVRVDKRCPSHITTLDPHRNFTPKDTYVFEYCFDSSMNCDRALEEIEGRNISPQEIENSTQDQAFVYASVGQPVLQNVLEGYNGCVFAYGQTGSGKTYTMLGPPTWARTAESARTPPQPWHTPHKATGVVVGELQRLKKESIPLSRGGGGEFSSLGVAPIPQFPSSLHAKVSTVYSVEGIIPRLLTQLFHDLHKKHQMDNTHSFRVEIEYFEIYNEKVINLLSTETQNVELRVRNSPRGPYVDGLQATHVEDIESVFQCLQYGNAARHSAATKFNDHSSRSHAILTLHLIQMNISGDDARSRLYSKINLVDLAGSERTGATGVMGKHFVESTRINLSLTVLGRVIDALADLSQGKQGIFCPYRDSNLTWLLRDSLGGNSKTTMIATVSPHSSSFEETCQTLRYSSRAKLIVTKAIVNEDPQQRLIKQLNMEVQRLRRLVEGEEDKAKNDYIDELRDRVVSLEAELSEKKTQLDRAESEIDLLRTSMEASKKAMSLSSSVTLSTADANTTKGLITALRSSIEKLEEENLRLLLTETELKTCKDERLQLERRLAQICKSAERESKSLQSNIRRLERENRKLEAEKAKFSNLNADLQAFEEREAELIARIQKLEQENGYLPSEKRSTTSAPVKSLDLSDKAKSKLQLMGLFPDQFDSLISASDVHNDGTLPTKVDSLVEFLVELAFKARMESSNIQNLNAPSSEQKNTANTTTVIVKKEKRNTKSKPSSGEDSRIPENVMEGGTCETQDVCGKLTPPCKRKGTSRTQADPKKVLVPTLSMRMPAVKDRKKDFKHRVVPKTEELCNNQPEVEKFKGDLKSSSKQHNNNEMSLTGMLDSAIDQQETYLQNEKLLLKDVIHSLISLIDNMKSLTVKKGDKLTEGSDEIPRVIDLLKDRLALLQATRNIPKEARRSKGASEDFHGQDLKEDSTTRHESMSSFETPADDVVHQKQSVHSNMSTQGTSAEKFRGSEEMCDNQHVSKVQLSHTIEELTTTSSHIPYEKVKMKQEIDALLLKYSELWCSGYSLYQEHTENLMMALTEASGTLIQGLTKVQLESTDELIHMKSKVEKLHLELDRVRELNEKELVKLKEIHSMALSNASERVQLASVKCAQLQEQVNCMETDRKSFEAHHAQSVKDLQDRLECTKEHQQNLELALTRATEESRVLREHIRREEPTHYQEVQEITTRVEILSEESLEALALATTHIKLASSLELEALRRQLDNASCEHEEREKSLQEQFGLLQKRLDEAVNQKENIQKQQQQLVTRLNLLSNEKATLSTQAIKMREEFEELNVGHRAAIELLEKEKDQLQLTKQSEVDSLKTESKQLHEAYAEIVESMKQKQTTLESFERTLREREDEFQKVQQQLEEVAQAREGEQALLASLKNSQVERQQLASELSDIKAMMDAYKKESLYIQEGMQEHIDDLSKKLKAAQNNVEILEFDMETKSMRSEQVVTELQDSVNKLHEKLQHADSNIQEKERIIHGNSKELSRLSELVEALEKRHCIQEQEKKALAADITHLQGTLDQEARHHLEVLATKNAELAQLQNTLQSIQEENERREEALRKEVNVTQASLNTATETLKAKEREFQSLQRDIQLSKAAIATLEAKEQGLHNKLRLQIGRSIQIVSDRDEQIAVLQEERRAARETITHLEEKLKATVDDKKKLFEQHIKQKGECERQSKQLIKSCLDLGELKRKISEKDENLMQLRERLGNEVNEKGIKLREVRATLQNQQSAFEKKISQLEDIVKEKDLELSQLNHDKIEAATDMRVLQEEYGKMENEFKVCASQLQYTDKAFTQYQFFMNQMETFFDVKVNYIMDALNEEVLDSVKVNKRLQFELDRALQESTHTANKFTSLKNALLEEKSAHTTKLGALLSELNQLSDSCHHKEVQLCELAQRFSTMQESYELEKGKWREEIAEKSEKIFELRRELDSSEKLRESLEGHMEEVQSRMKEEAKNYQATFERQENKIAELKEYLEFQASLDICEVESSRNTSFCKQPVGYSSPPGNSSTVHNIGSSGVVTAARSRVGGALMSLFQRKGAPVSMSSTANSDITQGVCGSAGAAKAIHLSKEPKNLSKNDISSFVGDPFPSIPPSKPISLHDYITNQSANSSDRTITSDLENWN